MPRKWSDVAASSAFQALSFDEQEEARRQYFDDIVAPQVPAEDVTSVRDQFFADTRSARGPEKIPEPTISSRVSGALDTLSKLPGDASQWIVDKVSGPRSVMDAPPRPSAQVTPSMIDLEQRDDLNRQVEAAPAKTLPVSSAPVSAEERNRLTAEYMSMTPAARRFVQSERGGYAGDIDRELAARYPAAPTKAPGAPVITGEIKPVAEPSAFSRVLDTTIAKPMDNSLAGALMETGGDALRGIAQGATDIPAAAWDALYWGAEQAAPGSDFGQIAKHAGNVGRETVAGFANPNDPDGITQSIFRSSVQSLMSAGLAGGFGNASIAVMAAASAAPAYGEARNAGKTHDEASERAAVNFLAEFLGEKVALPAFQKALSKFAGGGTIREFAAAVGGWANKELIGEELTTTAEDLYDKFGSGGLKPNMTVGDYLADVANTFKATIGQAALFGLGGGVVRHVAQRSAQPASDVAGDSYADAGAPERAFARGLNESVANTGWTRSSDSIARDLLNPDTYAPTHVETNFTPPGAPSQQAGLPDIIVPVPTGQGAVEAAQHGLRSGDGLRDGAAAATADGRALGGVDLGTGLGVPGPNAGGGTGRVGGVPGGLAAPAGTAAVDGYTGLESLPGVAEVTNRASDQELLGKLNAAEPVETWYGRRGGGYITWADANQALPGRTRMYPDLGWSVEQMPNGKFRLSGYRSTDESQAAQAEQAVQERPQAQAADPFGGAAANELPDVASAGVLPGDTDGVRLSLERRVVDFDYSDRVRRFSADVGRAPTAQEQQRLRSEAQAASAMPPASPEESAAVSAFGKLFSDTIPAAKQLRMVAFSNPRSDAANGISIGNVIAMNTAGSTMPAGQTAFHEFVHYAEQLSKAESKQGLTDTPSQKFIAQLYTVFDSMSDVGKQSYIEKYWKKSELSSTPETRAAQMQEFMSSPELRGEMTADFFGNRGNDREWLESVKKADPAGFSGFVEKWIGVLDNLIQTLRGRKDYTQLESAKVDNWVQDLARSKMVARDAFIQYRKSTSEMPAPDTAGKAIDSRKAEDAPSDNKFLGMPIREVPVADIRLSKDIPQFKLGANEAGVVEPLGGKFDRVGVAPIQVWKRNDGSLEVISGRHRLDLARRSGEVTIPAQIHDESRGFGLDRAAILDAELNIRDGQGKVKDYVQYFQGSGISREDADARGLLARATGRRAYELANSGGAELVAAHRADILSDEAATAIATAAPRDDRLQAVGIKAVQDGKSLTNSVNLIHAVRSMAAERADTTGDMFGFDESAMREAEEMAKIASRNQREIGQRVTAISGASKNPALAAKEGVNVKNPQAVLKRAIQLRAEQRSWDNWSTNPELVAKIRDEMRGNGFELSSQSSEDLRAQDAALRQSEAERKAGEDAAEQRARVDSEVGSFDLAGNGITNGQDDIFGNSPNDRLLKQIRQREQENTPEFKKWFRESRVVDQRGRPLVVYHGTNQDIMSFDGLRIGSNLDSGKLGRGFYFSSDPNIASSYARMSRARTVADAENVLPVYLSLKNPVEFKAGKNSIWEQLAEKSAELGITTNVVIDEASNRPSPEWSDAFTKAAQEAEHDGVVLEFQDGRKEFVVFRPEQIKSATGNRGTFDAKNTDIRYQTRGAQSADAFVQAPDGSINYGEITPDQGRAMRRQAGKIRLERGDKSYGLLHIEQRHGEQIRNIGFNSVEEFVFDALSHIDAIWKPSGTTQLVMVQSVERGKAVFVELKPSESGDYYTVKTAFPVADGYAQKKDQWKLLWDGASVPAIASGANPLAGASPNAGETTAMTPGQSSEDSVPPLDETDKPPTRGRRPIDREANFRRWSNDAPMVTSAEADTYEFKTGQKVVLESFHGTKRPDRVGEVFKKSRATSGPMSYFTSAPELASNYALGKSDTSLGREDNSYENWFKVKIPGERGTRNIVQAWYALPAEVQATIAERLPDIRQNDQGDVIYEKGGGDIGSYQWELKQTQGRWGGPGNPLKAAVETWMNSGAVFDREQDFMDVLRLAGFPMNQVEFDSPYAEYPAVYKTFIFMQSPLVVSDIPQSVKDALNEAAKRDRSKATANTDLWAKETRTLREWVASFNEPDNSYVWTSIPDKVTKVFESLGYDGIIDWSGKGGGHAHPVYIPFSETQVKSATGNKGTFDPYTKNILRQERQEATAEERDPFKIPEEGKTDAFRRRVQDADLRVRRVQDAVREQGGTVGEQQDVYGALELMPGRVQGIVDTFDEKIITPFVDTLAKHKIGFEEIGAYMYAKHAEERNQRIREINPSGVKHGGGTDQRILDAGSGMSKADADAILAKVAADPRRAGFEAAEKKLRVAIDANRAMALRYGLIDQNHYDALVATFDNYVPLRGLTGVETPRGTGRGVDIRGQETLAAMGRVSRASGIVENIVRDFYKTIVRGEKNSVDKVLLNLVLTNPDKSLWEIDPQTYERGETTKTVQVGRSDETGEPIFEDQREIRQTKHKETRDEVVALKVDGKPVYIRIKDDLLRRALLKEWQTGMDGPLWKTAAIVNGFLRSTLTRYNPAFAGVNMIRDSQQAATYILGEKGAGTMATYAKRYPKALAAAGRAEFGQGGKELKAAGVRLFGDPVMDKHYAEFVASGAMTGGFFMRDLEDIQTDIKGKMLEAGMPAAGFDEGVLKSLGERGLRLIYKTQADHLLHVLESVGSVSENATRFALYSAARSNGATVQQAATIAKNGTTNFNRKGEWGAAINTLYLFANASIQGARSGLHTIFKSPHKGQVAAMAVVPGVALGVAMSMLGAAVGGKDDDGEDYWDKISDFEKQRNWIIMLPPGESFTKGSIDRVGKYGRYIKIPMPYTWNILPGIGYAIGDVIRNQQNPMDGKKPPAALWRVLMTMLDNANPFGLTPNFGNPGEVVMAVSPTVTDIPLQFVMGVTTWGRQTSPGYDKDSVPDYEKVFASQADGPAHRVAREIFELTDPVAKRIGSNAFFDGRGIAILPGTLESAALTLGGGTGKFAFDLATTVMNLVDDQNPLPTRNIILLNKLYGEVGDVENEARAFEKSKEVKKFIDLEKQEKDLPDNGPRSAYEEIVLDLVKDRETFTKEMTRLRKEQIELMGDPAISQTTKRKENDLIRKEMDEAATEFNRVVRETFETYGGTK